MYSNLGTIISVYVLLLVSTATYPSFIVTLFINIQFVNLTLFSTIQFIPINELFIDVFSFMTLFSPTVQFSSICFVLTSLFGWIFWFKVVPVSSSHFDNICNFNAIVIYTFSVISSYNYVELLHHFIIIFFYIHIF